MHHLFVQVLAILLCASLWMPALAQAQDVIRVMSFNIRYNNPGDGINA